MLRPAGLALHAAASLNCHRAGPPTSISVVTRQAVVRRPLLPVAIEAESHRVIDDTLSDGHLREIAMTGRALHLRPDMRRMIEPHVRLFHKSINPLPCDILTTLCGRAQRLDSRIARFADLLMTAHTYIDAGKAGARPLHHAEVTVLAEESDVVGMDLMGKFNRLFGLGPDA